MLVINEILSEEKSYNILDRMFTVTLSDINKTTVFSHSEKKLTRWKELMSQITRFKDSKK